MKLHQHIQSVLCLLILISGIFLLNGCSPQSITLQEDMIRLVKNGELPRQMLNDISYQVREKIEQDTHSSFALDMDTYEDRLTYWANAEMADIRGIITRKYSEEPTSTDTKATVSPEILSVKTEILFTGFTVSDDQAVWQYVLAELTCEDGQWVVKNYDLESDESVDPDLLIDGETLMWLNN
ncbi:MAG: hypothetical protein ABFD58_06075 [Anaerolineaceae bacterium]